MRLGFNEDNNALHYAFVILYEQPRIEICIMHGQLMSKTRNAIRNRIINVYMVVST